MPSRWAIRLAQSLSTTGLLLGTLFFAASLTPSLLPRPPMTQGLVSGLSFSAGYGIGFGGRWLWAYLELPKPPPRAERIILAIAAALCAATAATFLWWASDWQDSIRLLMEMEPVERTRPYSVILIAAGVFGVVILIVRIFKAMVLGLSRLLKRFIPRRVSSVLGFLIVATLFWSLANGVLFRAALRVADSSFQQLDALVDAHADRPFDRPTDPRETGSLASLIPWDTLGRTGRLFLSGLPGPDDLRALAGPDAMQPIRVYVGLNSAETMEERARLALDELRRVGAFERSTLILATPTGTGWVDSAAIQAAEYLQHGDVATVAMQYSYLASWLALLAEPSYGVETARALFREVYDHWTRLPQDARPRLYLYGLSLGALNSDRSADLFDIIGDPYHGALWSGPPYASETWRIVTDSRRTNSAAWLPRFRDGTVVRFANQHGFADPSGTPWGPLRIVYLQYASDPVTFFEPDIFYRQPAWLDPPRGPDVSPELRWFPVVTFLQLIADLLAADKAPRGYGHVYAPHDYVMAWREVLAASGWDDADIARLSDHLDRTAIQPRRQ